MGGAWEVSGVLATVCSTLDLGTPDPVTSSLVRVLIMVAINILMQTRRRNLFI